SDCIFNGTVKRPPMGLAEVTITMEDPELAEAARFVMESGEQTQERDNAETQGTQDSPENAVEVPMIVETVLSLDVPADETIPVVEAVLAEEEAATNAKIVAADGQPAFLKSKKKKKAEKPEVVMRPGEVVVSRRLYRSDK